MHSCWVVLFIVGIILGGMSPPVSALPTFSSADVFVDKYGPNPVRPSGSYLLFSAGITGVGDITAKAIHQSGSGPDYSLVFTGTPLNPSDYSSRTPYTGESGVWSIVATDAEGTRSRLTHTLDHPLDLPLVQNLAASALLDPLAPLLTWDPIDASLYPTVRFPPINIGDNFFQFRVRVRTWGLAPIWQSDNLPTTATHFQLPAGILQPDTPYLLDVMLSQFEVEEKTLCTPGVGGCPSIGYTYRTYLESRSETFLPYSVSVPEPSTLLLLASGLAGLGGMAMRRR